jgi:hypothetical protein
MKKLIAPRALYLTPEDAVCGQEDPRRVSLLARKGEEIPADEVKRLGLTAKSISAFEKAAK